MGGLVGGLFDLFSGNPSQSEENTLGTVGNEQINTGEDLVTPAATYYEDLLSNDPTLEAQALAPEIKAGQDQVEQQKLTGSEFGTRSGGTAASTAAADAQERGNIIGLLGRQKAGAAAAAGNLGSEQESMGTGNVKTEADMANQNRQREVGDINGIAASAASIAMPFLAPGAGAGGADPFETLYNAQHADPNSIQTEEPGLSDQSFYYDPNSPDQLGVQ